MREIIKRNREAMGLPVSGSLIDDFVDINKSASLDDIIQMAESMDIICVLADGLIVSHVQP